MKNILFKFLVLFFLISIYSLEIYSQVIVNFGAGLERINHKAGFSNFEGIPRPKFQTPNTTENQSFVTFGLQYGFAKNWFINSNFSYLSLKTEFHNYEDLYYSNFGFADILTIEHQIDVNLKSYLFELGAEYNFWNQFNFGLGLETMLINSARFNQTQRIISPQNVDFVYPIQDYSGDIPKINRTSFLPVVRLSYNFLPNNTSPLAVRFESYYKFANDILADDDWRINRFGAAVKLAWEVNKEIEQIVIRDTILTNDTITRFVKGSYQTKINFLSFDIDSNIRITDNIKSIRYNIVKKYIMEVPKPKSLLSVELQTSFYKDGKYFDSWDFTKSLRLNKYEIYKLTDIKEESIATIVDQVFEDKIPQISFDSKVFSENGILNWEIVAFTDSNSFIIRSGIGEPKSNIVVDIEQELQLYSLINKTVKFVLQVEDFENEIQNAEGGILSFNMTNIQSITKVRKVYCCKDIQEVTYTLNKFADSNVTAFGLEDSQDIKHKKITYKHLDELKMIMKTQQILLGEYPIILIID